MIGVSYNGTLPNAVAVDRRARPGDDRADRRDLQLVRLLPGQRWRGGAGRRSRARTPTSWRRLVLTRRQPGGVRRRDGRAGTATRTGRPATTAAFWHERNYLRDAHKVRASVFAGARPQRLERQDQALRPVVGRARGATACRARSGCTRVRTPTRSTCAAPSGWRPCTAGSTSGCTGSTTASCASRWPTWRPRRTSGRTHRTWPVPGTPPTPLFLGPAADGRPGTLGRWPTGFGQRAVVRRRHGPDRRAAGRQRAGRRPEPAGVPHRAAGPRRCGCPARRGSPCGPASTARSPYLTALLVDYGTDDRFAGLAHGCRGRTASARASPEDPGCFDAARVRHRGDAVEDRQPRLAGRAQPATRIWRTRPRSTPGRTYTLSAGTCSPRTTSSSPATGSALVLISTDRDHTLRYRTGTGRWRRAGPEPRAAAAVVGLTRPMAGNCAACGGEGG